MWIQNTKSLILILGIFVASVASVDPDSAEDQECEGAPPGIKPGDITSNVIEALGVNYVERCQGGGTGHLIQEIQWRCDTRYCCSQPCECGTTNVQQDPCPVQTIEEMRCMLQSIIPRIPRDWEWECCTGYVPDPYALSLNVSYHCLITCEINNGNCHQACTNSPNAVCSCYTGYQMGQDGYTCVDIDECLVNKGGCSDICNNTVGGYFCDCGEGRKFAGDSITQCEEIEEPPVQPVAAPASQDSGNNNMIFIIVGIVAGLVLLGLLILLVFFLCRKKKRAEAEPYTGTAYANATYEDLAAQGAGARASAVYMEPTDVDEKKVPIEGAVGIDNPTYKGEKKALEAAGYAVPNQYEEIPYDVNNKKGMPMYHNNAGFVADSADGYERPVKGEERKMSLPGAVDDDNMDTHTYQNGARPKQQRGMPAPPEYSEIPTPGEVEADPRPPSYNNIGRRPVDFKGFRSVKYDNGKDKDVVDIKDIGLENKGKK